MAGPCEPFPSAAFDDDDGDTDVFDESDKWSEYEDDGRGNRGEGDDEDDDLARVFLEDVGADNEGFRALHDQDNDESMLAVGKEGPNGDVASSPDTRSAVSSAQDSIHSSQALPPPSHYVEPSNTLRRSARLAIRREGVSVPPTTPQPARKRKRGDSARQKDKVVDVADVVDSHEHELAESSRSTKRGRRSRQDDKATSSSKTRSPHETDAFCDPPPISAPPLADERLVETPLLIQYKLSYNTKYNLIICKLCESAVPLAWLHVHVTEPIVRVWSPKVPGQPYHGVHLENIAHGFAAPPPRQFEQLVKEEICAAVGADTAIRGLRKKPGKQEWTDDSIPDISTEGPILGLKVFSGLACTLCEADGNSHLSIARRGLDWHRAQMHKQGHAHRPRHQETSRDVFVQTFSRIRPLINYYEVSAMPPSRASSETDIDAATILQRQISAFFRIQDSGQDPKPEGLDQRSVPPFLFTSGIVEFLKNTGEDVIQTVLEIPPRSSRTFQRLRGALLESYYGDCDITMNLHPTIRHFLLSRRANGNQSKSFAPPALDKSKTAYIFVEFCFIWANLNTHRLSRQSDGAPSNSPICHNPLQSAALDKLAHLVNLEIEPSRHEVRSALENALGSLYFASERSSSAMHAFGTPLVSFFAMKCLSKCRFASLHELTTLLAKMLSCIRLRAGRHIQSLVRRPISSSVSEDWIQETALPFCRKHLHANQSSDVSVLLHYMEQLTVIARRTPRPCLIRWQGDHLSVEGKPFASLPRYTDFIQRELASAEVFVQERILFGVDLEALGILCSFNDHLDSGDETTIGYGSLTAGSTLENPDSRAFFNELVKNGALGLSVVNGSLVWNREQSIMWLRAIDELWKTLYALIHTTCGLPARAAEEVPWQLVNTKGSRRHLFIRNGSIAIVSNWHKGAFVSGMYKFILRLLPYRVARLIFILVRVVRPIEVMPTVLYLSSSENDNEKLIKLYHERLFVSRGKAWTTDTMSEALRLWFLRGLGVENIGVRLYRHVATALQRKLISPTDRLVQVLQQLADAQAGRSVRMSTNNYALEQLASGGLQSATVDAFEALSMEWHQMLGLETHARHAYL